MRFYVRFYRISQYWRWHIKTWISKRERIKKSYLTRGAAFSISEMLSTEDLSGVGAASTALEADFVPSDSAFAVSASDLTASSMDMDDLDVSKSDFFVPRRPFFEGWRPRTFSSAGAMVFLSFSWSESSMRSCSTGISTSSSWASSWNRSQSAADLRVAWPYAIKTGVNISGLWIHIYFLRIRIQQFFKIRIRIEFHLMRIRIQL